MTVKRRLFVSNILMIIIPVILSTAISYVILFLFTQRSSEPIERAFPQVYDIIVRYQISGDREALYSAVDHFNDSFSPEGIHIAVMEGADFIHPPGAEVIFQHENRLLQTMLQNEATGSLVINNQRLLIEQVGSVRIVVIDTNNNRVSFHSPLTLLPFLFLLAVGAIVLTNLLLTHLVSNSIRKPMRLLAEGAHQLGEGNLDFRISYTGKDEFRAVCDDFNLMADHLQRLIRYREKSEENRKELLAGISHDLRTPLTSIKAYVEGLLDGVAEDLPAQLKYLSIIRNRAADIDRLVDKLFLFSKLDIGDYPVNPERVDLGEELHTTAGVMAEEFGADGLIIELCDIPQGRYFIYMDPVYLRGILRNIFENSVRYKHKERCHITVACAANAQRVTLQVTDDGPGVAEQELEKIFEVFYRGDPSRRNPSKGSGLGLAICAKMMERAGGSIRAENVDESGGLRLILEFQADAPTEPSTVE